MSSDSHVLRIARSLLCFTNSSDTVSEETEGEFCEEKISDNRRGDLY